MRQFVEQRCFRTRMTATATATTAKAPSEIQDHAMSLRGRLFTHPETAPLTKMSAMGNTQQPPARMAFSLLPEVRESSDWRLSDSDAFPPAPLFDVPTFIQAW